MAKQGTKVDELFLSLGIDMSQWDVDMALADKTIKEATDQLNREKFQAKLKFDIDEANMEGVKKTTADYDKLLGHINDQLNAQKQIVALVDAEYKKIVQDKGAEDVASQKVMTRLLREQKVLSDIEKQARISPEANKMGGLNELSGNVRQIMAEVGIMFSASMAFNWFKEANAEMESYRIRIGVLIKDSQEAQRALREMVQFADSTPFKTNDVIEAGERLIAAGVTDYKKYLTAAGDWAAATGRGITETADAFSRIMSGEYGRSIELMRTMHINTLDLMAEGLRFSKGNEYLGTTEQLMAAVERIVNSRFGGMTDKLSHSWKGLWSTFTSNAEESARQLTSGPFLVIEDGLASITKKLQELNQSGDLKKIGDSFAMAQLNDKYGKGPFTVFSMLKPPDMKSLAQIDFMKDLFTKGYGDAITNYHNRVDELKKQFEHEKNVIIAGTSEVKESWGSLKKADDTRTHEDTIKDLLKKRQEQELQIDIQKKIFDTDIAIKRAHHLDSVTLAKEESDFEQANLKKMEENENRLKMQMGDKYQPSDNYLQQKIKAAEALSKQYTEAINKADALGQYSSASKKLIAEAEAIEKLGGDSTVKRYQAMTAAIKEYIDNLDKLQTTEIETWTSSTKLDATEEAATKGNLQSLQTNLEVIDNQEKQMNVERLRNRWDTLNQMLSAENLGAQQRKEIYEQESRAFIDYQNGMAGAIQDTMAKIDSLQQKAMSAGSKAVDILAAHYKNDPRASGYFDQINGMMNDVWYSSKEHSLDQISSMLSFQSKIKDLVGPGTYMAQIDPSIIMDAMKKEIKGIPDKIKEMQQGLNDLLADSTKMGKTAADNFFSPWVQWIDTLKGAMGGLGSNIKTPDLSGNITNLSRNYGVTPVQHTTNHITVSVPVTAAVNSETDVGVMAERVANIIVRRVDSLNSSTNSKISWAEG